jgi:hypothetical protein
MLRSVRLGNRWRLCGLALAIAGCADGEDAPEGERDASVITDRDSAVVRRDDAAVVDASKMDAQLPATDASVAADASVVFASGPIRPTRYRVPEPVTQPCSGGGSGTVKTHEVLIGQTHLTPKAWPLQTVSANRPLTIAIAVSGSGSAPSFEASVTSARTSRCSSCRPRRGTSTVRGSPSPRRSLHRRRHSAQPRSRPGWAQRRAAAASQRRAAAPEPPSYQRRAPRPAGPAARCTPAHKPGAAPRAVDAERCVAERTAHASSDRSHHGVPHRPCSCLSRFSLITKVYALCRLTAWGCLPALRV